MTRRSVIEITFSTFLYKLKDWLILPIPQEESVKLPSRGQVSVDLEINGRSISTVLEPDGQGSHWVRIHDELRRTLNVGPSSRVDVMLRTNALWPEPLILQDVQEALDSASDKVQHKWQAITPMARWEWVRWINATNSDETRVVRIQKTISKLEGTHRRPCCFNLTACTEPYVAKNGRLIESTD